MAEVTVRVNGRDYTVACADGEEAHLQQLAQFINQRVGELVEQVGQVGEARLLLMAALLVADELAEALHAGGAADAAAGSEDEQAIAGLAERLEHIAALLESA